MGFACGRLLLLLFFVLLLFIAKIEYGKVCYSGCRGHGVAYGGRYTQDSFRLIGYEQAISQGQDTVAKHHGMQAPEGQPMEMAGM